MHRQRRRQLSQTYLKFASAWTCWPAAGSTPPKFAFSCCITALPGWIPPVRHLLPHHSPLFSVDPPPSTLHSAGTSAYFLPVSLNFVLTCNVFLFHLISNFYSMPRDASVPHDNVIRFYWQTEAPSGNNVLHATREGNTPWKDQLKEEAVYSDKPICWCLCCSMPSVLALFYTMAPHA